MMSGLNYVIYPQKAEYAEVWAGSPATYDHEKHETCPQCGRSVSFAYWERPRTAILTSRKLPDFLYTYHDRVRFLLSENALTKMQNGGITGIINAEKIENVRFQRKSRQADLVPTYYRIELARSKITINHSESVIHYGTISQDCTCSLCNPVPASYNFFKWMALNMENYEGFDIFHTYELRNAVFVSQRFVDFCKENRLTNLWCLPAEIHDIWGREHFFKCSTSEDILLDADSRP